MCKNCNPDGPCFLPDTYYVYHVEEFGSVTEEDNMMQEIYQRGPISCGIAVPDSLENYTGGIYNDTTGDTSIVHEVSVVGWGVENGVKYWTVRNSWGSHWGEGGFFRVVRGTNNIGIESECAWAVPTDTWTNPWIHYTTDAEKEDPNNDFSNPGTLNSNFLDDTTCTRKPADFGVEGELRTQPMSWEMIDATTLPKNWDWRNVNSTNFLSWTLN
jgi:cathepsin X